MSNKRAAEQVLYLKLRKQYLIENPRCHACLTVKMLQDVPLRTAPSVDVHHKHGRGKFLCDVSTWAAVCRTCHDFIESNKRWAREVGFVLYK